MPKEPRCSRPLLSAHPLSTEITFPILEMSCTALTMRGVMICSPFRRPLYNSVPIPLSSHADLYRAYVSCHGPPSLPPSPTHPASEGHITIFSSRPSHLWQAISATCHMRRHFFAVAHRTHPNLALEPWNLVFSGSRDHAVSAPSGNTFPVT
jgi:hypothetical protein